MNEKEFAQKIKAKYPQYKDVDDVELTTKILAKYPQYASQVKTAGVLGTKKDDTLTGKVLDNSITRGIRKFFPGEKVGQAIGTAAGAVITKGKDLITGSNDFQNYDLSSPSVGQVAGDVVAGAATIGGFKAPMPVSAVGRVAQSAGLGGVLGGSQAVAEGKDLATVAKEVKSGATTGAIFQGVFEAVPAVTKLVGGIAGKQANALREKNLRLSPLQKEKLNSKIEGITNYLAKNKVKGNPEQQYTFMSNKLNEMEKQVQGVISKSGKTYTKDEVIKTIAEIPNNYATEFDNPEVYDQLVKKSEKFIEYLTKNFGDEIPASKLNQFKRAYSKNGFNRAGDAISNEASLAIGDSLYSKILADIPELSKINDEYSTVILGKKILGKALGRNELGMMGNIASTIGGTIVGSAVGGPAGSVAGAIVGPKIGKAISGTAARTNYARALEQVKTLASKVPKDGSVTLPRALLNAIINQN